MPRTLSIAGALAVGLLLSSRSLYASPALGPDEAPRTTAAEPSAAIAILSPVGVTAGGIGLMMAGMFHEDGEPVVIVGGLVTLFGPGVGHLYAGENGRAAAAAATRLVGLTAMFLGQEVYEEVGDSEGRSGHRALRSALNVTGALLYVGAMAYDLIDAPFAARRARARSLTLTPTFDRSPSATVGGVALVGSF